MATVVLSALVFSLLKVIGVELPGFTGEVVVALTALFGSYLFISLITNLMVGDLVRKVHSIAAAAEGRARTTLLKFVDRHLARLDEQISLLVSEKGALLDIQEVKFWTELCFEFGEGRYDGTDSHLPSEFLHLYPTYLAAHGDMLRRHRPPRLNSRILIGNPHEFRDDYLDENNTGYERFLAWHDRYRVPLLHIDGDRAASLRRGLKRSARDGSASPGMLPTGDLAIWHGQYALLFRDDPRTGKIRLWMRFPGDSWYEQCRELIDLLRGKDGEVGQATALRDAAPEIFERDLCLEWEDFVAPTKRMETLGPFLERALGADKTTSVLDAAAGIGCDAIWLAEQGYEVTLNEIEPVYRDIIEERFRERFGPVPPRVYGEDWRKLPSRFGAWFDTVLVLGNSLCLLSSAEEQERAIRAFIDVLKPGGQIIVDERNFEHFATPQATEEIRRNPIRNFPYSGNYLYCGTRVKGCPKSFTANEVVFRYYHSDPAFERAMKGRVELAQEDFDELQQREIGVLHLYPFRRGELGRLLERCGLDEIRVVADLDWENAKAYAAGTGDWFDPDADFFTYTARKPLTGSHSDGERTAHRVSEPA